MTRERQISVNIAIDTAVKNGVVFVEQFMSNNKSELLKVMKEAETTEHWALIEDKVKELVNG